MTSSEHEATPIIRANKMNKFFGVFHALKDIDLTVARGETVVLCGPSGSGKSTLIRCLNALENHQKGELEVAGVQLTGKRREIDMVRRKTGMVFRASICSRI